MVAVKFQALQVSELTNITGSKDWGKAVDKYMRRGLNPVSTRIPFDLLGFGRLNLEK